MSHPAESVHFTFCNPVDQLLRILLLSPLAADASNLALVPEEGPYYRDFIHGERLARIHAAIPPGSFALTCVLFFDECNRDEKGMDTGDGAIIVAGFLPKHLRESTHAKVSFGTFPKVIAITSCALLLHPHHVTKTHVLLRFVFHDATPRGRTSNTLSSNYGSIAYRPSTSASRSSIAGGGLWCVCKTAASCTFPARPYWPSTPTSPPPLSVL